MSTKTLFTSLFFVLCFLGHSKNNRSNPAISFQQTNDLFTLSGYISEKESGENLLGVSVYVPELKLGTTTNDYGFFSLSLPQGKHQVNISSIGYITLVNEIDLTSDSQITFVLEPMTENLEEVTVSADKGTKQSKVTQMSTVQLNPSIVKDVPALLGEKDVLKTLQLLPGIQGGNEGSAGFFVRGGTPDQNLIILDEAVVYNSNHLFGFFSVFNGDAIKSVEAFKGGFPARFGGRLSSVIKIDMKDGNKEKLSGQFNIGLISSSLVLEGPINKGKTSFIISARRTYADVLARPFLNEEDGRGGYFFMDLNAKVHHIFNVKNKLYWSTYLGRDSFYSDTKNSNSMEKVRLGWGNITSTLRWNHQFNSKLFSNTSLIFSNYQFRILDEFEETFNGMQESFFFKSTSGINDFSLKTDFDYFLNGNHTFRLGAMATRHNFTPQRVLLKDQLIDDIDTKQELNSFEGAAYIEENWRIGENLKLSPGIRVSYFKFEDTDYLNPELRLAAAFNLKPDLALKASYSRMNQYIHLLSSSGIGLPTDLWVSSTDNVKPQESQQVAFGVAKDFDNDFSLTLEGYYKTLDNVIAYKEGASFLALNNLDSGREIDWEENITAGRGWAYGAELLLRKQQGNLTGWLGYTLSWSERQFDELNLGNTFFDRYDRRHDFSLVGIYKPSQKTTFSANWVLSSGNNYTLPNLQRFTNQNAAFPFRSPFLFGGETENFATARNNFRGETSHRLDLGVQFHKKTIKGRQSTWGISVYNAYARQNPFIYTVEDSEADFEDPNPTSEKELVRTSVLLLIPSVNYTYKF